LWGDREAPWKPSLRVCPQVCKSEPNLFSQGVPFVQRRGSQILYHHAKPLPPASDDFEVERFNAQAARKAQQRKMRAVIREDQRERAMVRDLEAWEKSHLWGGVEATSASRSQWPAAMTTKSGSLRESLLRRSTLLGRSAHSQQSGRLMQAM